MRHFVFSILAAFYLGFLLLFMPKPVKASVSFNGTTDTLTWTTVNFSGAGYHKIAVSFWLLWPTFANDFKFLYEANNTDTVAGSVYLNPDSSDAACNGRFEFTWGAGDGANYNATSIARPSAGVWHHYYFVWSTRNASISIQQNSNATVDGTQAADVGCFTRAAITGFTGAVSGVWCSSIAGTHFCPNGTQIAEIAWWGSTDNTGSTNPAAFLGAGLPTGLTGGVATGDVAALASGVPPNCISAKPLRYWPLNYVNGADYSLNASPITLNGTSAANHPPMLPCGL